MSHVAESRRQLLDVLHAQLEQERAPFLPHWRDLGEHIMPWSGRFDQEQNNRRGATRNGKIIDNTGTIAARTCTGGMVSGNVSPSNRWYRLKPEGIEIEEDSDARWWVDDELEAQEETLLRSNFYQSAATWMSHYVTFGTAAMSVEEDFERVFHCYNHAPGTFMIANDHQGRVNVFMRDFRMTVRQFVDTFGEREDGNSGDVHWEHFSEQVKRLWEAGQRETWVDVVHAIVPNDEYDAAKPQSKFKKYKSCYYERGTRTGVGGGQVRNDDDERFLRESGYDYFPVIVGRWEVSGEDVYGTNCPGMMALADIKELQHHMRRVAQAIDKIIKPPMIAPTHLRQSRLTVLPDDITYADEPAGQPGFRPAYQIDFRFNEVENLLLQLRQRIDGAFYVPLWQQISALRRREITAREIEERSKEKLEQLGPVTTRVTFEFVDPVIEIVSILRERQGLMLPAPESLQGRKLKVEYISIMQQAAKMQGVGLTERFAGIVAQISQFDPQVLDKIDRDQLVDELADMMSIPPRIIVSDEQVAEIRARRVEQQKAQAAQQLIVDGAKAAKDLSGAKMDEDSALTRLLAAKGA